MTADAHHDEIVHVATRLGKKQRDRELRIIVAGGLLTAVLLFIGLWILWRAIDGMADKLEANQMALQDSLAEYREVNAREQAQLEEILAGIRGRLVPREDVFALEEEVRELKMETRRLTESTRNLTRSVRQLQAQLAAAGVAGSG